MAAHNQNDMQTVDGHHEEGMDKKRIWKVFFYLLALTALEFFIALALVHKGHLEKGMFVNTIYIVLTLMKAYYIVAYFMHLKFETIGFITWVSVAFIFIIYFIILLLNEGNYLLSNYNEYPWWPNP